MTAMKSEPAQLTPFKFANNDVPIGAILIRAGRLTPADAKRILKKQADENLQFGAAGIKLGLITEEDIQFALNRQFDYPCLSPQNGTISHHVVAAFAGISPQVEALRALRSQLMLRWFSSHPRHRTLAIISQNPGDGRSWMTANLAVVLSQLGQRTLVIDANMRQPKLHQWFGLDNRLGLAAVLSRRGGPQCIQPVPDIRGLSVLPAGAQPPNPQELLARPAFAALLKQSADVYDAVLIDTPPGAQFADGHMISARANGALLIARQNVSTMNAIKSFGNSLHQAGVNIIGTVLNEF